MLMRTMWPLTVVQQGVGWVSERGGGDEQSSSQRGPTGTEWRFTPDQPLRTTISGDGVELCLVAARRVDPGQTSLTGDGPDATAVLELVRTYA